MKMTRWTLAVMLLAIATLLAVAEATAQYGGVPGGGMGGRRGARMGMDKGNAPGASRATQENVTDLVEFRLGQLQEDLNLTREQETLWIAYEGRVKALATDITREHGREQSTSLHSALEQVNHAVDVARDRLTAWEEIAAASKGLYDGLTPQQKQVADQRFPSILSALSGAATLPAPRI